MLTSLVCLCVSLSVHSLLAKEADFLHKGMLRVTSQNTFFSFMKFLKIEILIAILNILDICGIFLFCPRPAVGHKFGPWKKGFFFLHKGSWVTTRKPNFHF